MAASNVVQLVPSVPASSPASPREKGVAEVSRVPNKGKGTEFFDRYLVADAIRLQDALVLARCGLGIRSIHVLTGYTSSFLTQLYNDAGIRAQGGRSKTRLSDCLRDPVHHATLGNFLATVDFLFATGPRKLNSRIFVTALRTHVITTSNVAAQIEIDHLFTAAQSMAEGKIQLRFCTSCRTNFAHCIEPSSLAQGKPYGCPGCREMAVMASPGDRSRSKSKPDSHPSCIADLNIDRPMSRFRSQSPDRDLIHQVLRASLG